MRARVLSSVEYDKIEMSCQTQLNWGKIQSDLEEKDAEMAAEFGMQTAVKNDYMMIGLYACHVWVSE